MKRSIKMLAAALAAVMSISAANVTAFAQKLMTEKNITYRYSDEGKKLGKYTGWAKTKSGKYRYYENGVIVRKNTVIEGTAYKFDKNGFYGGKYTGWIKSINEDTDTEQKRYFKNGKVIENKWMKIGGKYSYAGIDGYIIVEGADEKFPELEDLSDEEMQHLTGIMKEKVEKWKEEYKKTWGEDLENVFEYEFLTYLGTYSGKPVAVFHDTRYKIYINDIHESRGNEIYEDIILPTTYYGMEIYFFENGTFNSVFSREYDNEKDKYIENFTYDEAVKIRYYNQRYLLDLGFKTFVPMYERLSAKKRQAICDDYLRYKSKNSVYSKFTADDLSVGYYGSFDGGDVVDVYPKEWEYTEDEKTYEIAGYEITVGSGSIDLMLYRDGTFIGIEKAYELGYLTDDDIKTMAD